MIQRARGASLLAGLGLFLLGQPTWAQSASEAGIESKAEVKPNPAGEELTSVEGVESIVETTTVIEETESNGDPANPAYARGKDDMGFKTDVFGDELGADSKALPEDQSGVRYLLGARYRALIVPKFVLNIFGDGGKNLFFPASGGLELSIHAPKVEYNISLWYAGYGFEDMVFKGNHEPEAAWEDVDSTLKTIYATVDFLWLAEVAPSLDITYGFSLGLGYVFGELKRTQAYPPYPGAPGEEWLPCNGPGDPNRQFCATGEDEHYDYIEPNWFNGGSKPVVFPWIALQTGLRYQIQDIAMRLDLGVGTSAFFVGVGADVGL